MSGRQGRQEERRVAAPSRLSIDGRARGTDRRGGGTTRRGTRSRHREDPARVGRGLDRRSATRPRSRTSRGLAGHGARADDRPAVQGCADWNGIGEVVVAVDSIPVVGNGDVVEPEDVAHDGDDRMRGGDDRQVPRSGHPVVPTGRRRGATRLRGSRRHRSGGARAAGGRTDPRREVPGGAATRRTRRHPPGAAGRRRAHAAADQLVRQVDGGT